MPDLPARPDLDQLRHQAKELLRAAQRGDPEATARIRAVTDRVVLSSAQLALAREYGFASWAKLKLEVERRDVLNSRDLSRLTSLLAEHPELATAKMEHWCDHQLGADPLSYMAMLRFDHDRLGLPRRAARHRRHGQSSARRRRARQRPPWRHGDPADHRGQLRRRRSRPGADRGRGRHRRDLRPRWRRRAQRTALEHAAVFGMTEVVDVLVAAGAAHPQPGDGRRRRRRHRLAAGPVHAAKPDPGAGIRRRPPATGGHRRARRGRNPGQRGRRRVGHGCRCTPRRATAGPPASGGCSPTAPTPTSATPGTTPLRWKSASEQDSPGHREVEAILRPLTRDDTQPSGS